MIISNLDGLLKIDSENERCQERSQGKSCSGTFWISRNWFCGCAIKRRGADRSQWLLSRGQFPIYVRIAILCFVRRGRESRDVIDTGDATKLAD